MTMSGIKFSEEMDTLVKEEFKAKESDMAMKLAIIRLNDKNNGYVLDKVIMEKEKIPGFLMRLSRYVSEEDYRDTPCWLLFKTHMKLEQKLEDKLFCVYWCPDTGPVSKKMTMSASSAAFKAVPSAKYKEFHDAEDWCITNFMPSFSGKLTMVDDLPVFQKGKDYVCPEEYDEVLQKPLNVVNASEYLARRYPETCGGKHA